MIEVGLAGGTLAYRDQELMLFRNGRPEQVWMNLDYSPLLDERGMPAGVIAIVSETTAKVRAERTPAGEQARLRQLFEQAPGLMAMLEVRSTSSPWPTAPTSPDRPPRRDRQAAGRGDA